MYNRKWATFSNLESHVERWRSKKESKRGGAGGKEDFAKAHRQAVNYILENFPTVVKNR